MNDVPSLLALSDEALVDLVLQIKAGWPVEPLPRLPGPVHAVARKDRREVGGGWWNGERATLPRLIEQAERLGAERLQLDLCHRFRPVGRRLTRLVFRNANRGLIGIQIRFGAHLERHPPSMMIARNQRFARILERFYAAQQLDEDAFQAGGGKLEVFDARQVLIDLAPQVRATTLFRGGRLVRPDALDHRTVARMIDELGGWLARQLEPSGRMPYAWWPSAEMVPDADNPIRQFMATLALVRLARRSGARADLERAERNLAHNLGRFYLRLGAGDDAHGMIVHEGSAKLGAAALAALAILEAPFRARFEAELQALHAGVLALREPGGRFRSFHFPAERAYENQNFYPGEAQLYLASRLRIGSDSQLLASCLESADWYRRWHQAHQNPAFVPWHTQANALLFELSGEAWLRDSVFEMNDWLTHLQQWADAPVPDLAGRFYAPDRPAFGPPHASSTGVYLEGLADALRLAGEVGDQPRVQAYRRTIWRGLRSLRQLQFKDEVDAFYVAEPARVLGGLRTETYDNRIRIDNVQHALMALLKLERLPAFRDEAAF